MTTIQFAIIALTALLSALFFKLRGQLNYISQCISNSRFERNKLEVVMQPKWLLYSTWIIAILWIITIYILIVNQKWWSILYIALFYLSIVILSKLLIIPTNAQIRKLFYETSRIRISKSHLYTIEELQYLKAVLSKLKEILNL